MKPSEIEIQQYAIQQNNIQNFTSNFASNITTVIPHMSSLSEKNWGSRISNKYNIRTTIKTHKTRQSLVANSKPKIITQNTKNLSILFPVFLIKHVSQKPQHPYMYVKERISIIYFSHLSYQRAKLVFDPV